MDSSISKLIDNWRGGLIVSCQAPENSPLAKPEIIAAFAETAEQNGAVGVRIDAPHNISAVKSRVAIPVLGIYKIVAPPSEVYITPTFQAAAEIAAAGADMIALDATCRARPDEEKLDGLVRRIRESLKKPLMADVARYEEGLHAAETLGVDVISTTLSGYTAETRHLAKPDFELVEKLSTKLTVPIVCEGRLRSAEDVRRAFDCGAFAVVVGGAITGIDQLVSRFAAATPVGSAKT
ncbi:MAG TPA: N-acetylmannosamine-6-phosphate 2-epimerase [Pyrinomonadaceae bacterium]|jgi:N-acylglucosamine-6-phosphate 2-epimerase